MTKLKILLFFMLTMVSFAQNEIKINAKLLDNGKKIDVVEEIILKNTSTSVLTEIALNDWNHAYSSKKSALASKFSDEYNRSFHLSKKADRGETQIFEITNQFSKPLSFYRNENQVDIVRVKLENPLQIGETTLLKIKYQITLPNTKFTKFGYSENKILLKNCFLTISPFDTETQSEENSDDLTSEISNYKLDIQHDNLFLTTDLDVAFSTSNSSQLIGNSRTNFFIALEKEISYEEFKNKRINVITNLKSKDVPIYYKVLVIEKITNYVAENIGISNQEKIMVSQEDYDREAFYGLNELPSFISPFNDDFVFELKFLKTYLNNYLAANLKINFRKDHWILEGIQHYYIKKYIDDNYPDTKAFGRLSRFGILKSYKIINMNFTEQFIYNYLLMARKNIDQSVGSEKNTQIKFNEKIAGKFKSGLSLHYLNNYLGNDILENSIKQFVKINATKNTNNKDFKKIIENNSNRKLDWFFDELIYSRNKIDYKISQAKKRNDSIEVTIKNVGDAKVPVSIYGYNKNKLVSKNWIENDSETFKFSIKNDSITKFVLNDTYEIPEINNNNNSYKLKNRFLGNRKIRFTFFKDIENAKFNQVFYVPTAEFNLYDGILLGMKINNKSIINKPFTYDLTPNYSTKTGTIAGSAGFGFHDQNRKSTLYNTRYGISGTRLHYAPDAFYTKITPSINFSFRNPNFRKNEGEGVTIRQVYVNREKSNFVTTQNTENYSVFNLRYGYGNSELVKQFSYGTDLQVSSTFGKVSGQIQYRKLFENNRYINLRAFGGFFTHNDNTNDFFSFGIDRPSDYMFDYALVGRSESTGLFSRQFVNAEGAFKSIFDTRFANQYIFTVNASFNIWNWIELYGDVGTYKNQGFNSKYIYDSGVHLNLVQDYFELFFPVYSSNGFELNDKNYGERIRFIITVSPKTLTSLFTRRWF
ncbi:gluzincin family metallopeptidase [Flavobacterium facile]|uniref:aminopeptidase n=1 Tax=Flavobacterium facile TaxID=2893174 RepID=UPI002E79D753|nr:aminopeptidase [Flavobacterium sp. T-12]